MTTQLEAPPGLPNLSGWAAAVLGVTPESSAAEVRAVYLKRLAQSHFTSQPVLERAFDLLGKRGPTPTECRAAYEPALFAEEVRLREEVETYSAAFFTLPTDERRRRWSELSERCAWSPQLEARLQILEKGLDTETSAIAAGEPMAVQLVNKLQAMYVARPSVRAAQRQACRQLLEDNRDWRRAAEYVKRQFPRLAALEPGLFEPAPKRVKAAPAAKASDSSGIPGWVISLILMVGLGIMRAASSSNSQSTPTSHPFRPMAPPPATSKIYQPQTLPDLQNLPPNVRLPQLPGQNPGLPFQQPSARGPAMPGQDPIWNLQQPRVRAPNIPGMPGQNPGSPYRQPGIPGVPQIDPLQPRQQPGMPQIPGMPGSPYRPGYPNGQRR